MKRYTISDIAKMANASPASVSRVISGRPGVNKTKRMEIQKIIEETNYHPNSSAQSLVRGCSNVIGLIVRDLENQYYASLAALIQSMLMDRGYMTMILDIGKRPLTAAARKGVDFVTEINRKFDFAGLFISVPNGDDLLIDGIRGCSCPVVLLNRAFDVACDQVTQNDFQAGFLAGQYLLDIGHREFLLMPGPIQSSVSCRFRMEGFVQAVAAAGIEIDESQVMECSLDMDQAYEVGRQVLRRFPELPQAIFIASNNMALGFMQACGEAGVPIPSGISVITIDNTKIMALPGIDLTGVSVSLEQLATEAVEVMVDRIETKREKNRFVSLQPELTIRGSTAPPSRPYRNSAS